MLEAADIAVILTNLAVSAWAVRRVRQAPEEWRALGLAVGLGAVVLGVAGGTPYLFPILRLWAWGLFLTCPLYALVSAWCIRSTHPVGSGVQVAAAILLLALGVDAFLVEPQALQITRYTVVSDKVRVPVRIGLLADLQTDDPGPYEREAIRRLLDQAPDVILWAGDYVQHRDKGTRNGLIHTLNGQLTTLAPDPPLGMVAVAGNCEQYPGWARVFDGLPVEVSNDTERHDLGPLTVTALSFDDGFDTLLGVDAVSDFHVVLAHGPDFALGDIEADLLLAGHTHGGQVRIPLVDWPPITFSKVPRSWAAGRTELDGGRTLIVSRGVGMERDGAPPMRLACRPELVVIDVVPPTEPGQPLTPPAVSPSTK